MTHPPRFTSTHRTVTPDELLSVEPERRAIELAFVRRIAASFGAQAAALLEAANSARPEPISERAFNAHLARMQHPMFRLLARWIERDIPKRDGFGKFGDHR